MNPGKASPKIEIDVLCAGQASWDLVLAVSEHPGADEKSSASQFYCCGGGPAANAAVAAARLGCTSALAAYLGNDLYGQLHLAELSAAGVLTDFIMRGDAATALSIILVKPDGQRSVVSYRSAQARLAATSLDFSPCAPRVVLIDGHEPAVSEALLQRAVELGIPIVLDAGSVHKDTAELVSRVDYVVASARFSRDFTGAAAPEAALQALRHLAPHIVITLGEQGLVWATPAGQGRLKAFAVQAVDTTGAGDAFHGAFAAGLARGRSWQDLLEYASAAAALCCTGYGGRLAIPDAPAVERLLASR